MERKKTSEFIFDCAVCPTRCDGVSKMVYTFSNDVSFSEQHEKVIIEKINAGKKFIASKTKESGYPDLQIANEKHQIISYLEVKVQQRTFMSVEKIIPESNLKPSETVALNLSDLLRYFEIKKENGIPTSIVWVVLNRPCLVMQNEVLYYFQKIDELERIYNKEGDKRRFRRKSGEGDVVDGIHKGVTVNYHFSLKELKPWDPLSVQ